MSLEVEKNSVELSPIHRITYKLYDNFGSTCYKGNDYNEAINKARTLPYTLVIYAFNENGESFGAVWARYGSGIATINIGSLMPN